MHKDASVGVRLDPLGVVRRHLGDNPHRIFLDQGEQGPAGFHPFTHQELVLRRALGLGDDVQINPSGGALAGNPMFAGGLTRIGEAANRILSGDAGRVLGHATSGPALQHNLVCVMEGLT